MKMLDSVPCSTHVGSSIGLYEAEVITDSMVPDAVSVIREPVGQSASAGAGGGAPCGIRKPVPGAYRGLAARAVIPGSAGEGSAAGVPTVLATSTTGESGLLDVNLMPPAGGGPRLGVAGGRAGATRLGGVLPPGVACERKGCCSRREALGRSLGTRLKHRSKKSLASGDRCSGMGGGSLELAIWYMADIGSLNSLQGGFPVAISMTVQPTDQMSAWRPWPVALITSGAIQYGVPLIDLYPESIVTRFSIFFEAPKSASFTTPELSTRMLAPLMSLCMIWCLWRKSRPRRICFV
mmetsp:Transcript_6143/g.14823  ORF Transcript_6143/g.14823 Transcript_6143/m.14823 type:complete len:294 (+) Transcript_6143:792-1673(+)